MRSRASTQHINVSWARSSATSWGTEPKCRRTRGRRRRQSRVPAASSPLRHRSRRSCSREREVEVGGVRRFAGTRPTIVCGGWGREDDRRGNEGDGGAGGGDDAGMVRIRWLAFVRMAIDDCPGQSQTHEGIHWDRSGLRPDCEEGGSKEWPSWHQWARGREGRATTPRSEGAREPL